MNLTRRKLQYAANNNTKVAYENSEDNREHGVLTVDSFSHLIKHHDGSLLLKPLEDLLIKNSDDETELLSIVKESENTCDAFLDWYKYWALSKDLNTLVQAPYEVVEELIFQGYDVFSWIELGEALDTNTQ